MSFVQLKNIHKTYLLGETKVHALRGLNFEIKKGDFLALMGASGSGKSTLLNMIGCIDNPDSGEILFDDVVVNKLNEDQKSELRSQKIGFIFQSFNLMPVLNVYENVELPLMLNPSLDKETRYKKVMSAIKDVELEKFMHHIPDKLSGGQRQRVAIARALVTEPSLILADEPTANLDSTTAHKIIDLMLELNSKRHVTFLFATHDEKLVQRVKRIVHIKDGLIN